ncbi:MAG: serine acetyltransferase, partial [Oscillospiraceae bacterium]|nr:serine acetyltransferase [Oscillospiraceae bacterium]
HGGIVVNPNVRAGKNCQLHGGNCIGNNGKTQGVPTIGDNADLGYGACIIGEVRLADDVTVGCNAVVVHNCDECGAVLVGIPAKKLR